MRILAGDCRVVLRRLEAESVNCVVTSPPYWGLRDYGVDGQLGLELSLGEHIAVMVDVFREVRRVLRDDGVVWINYGDCYATAPNGRSAADTKALTDDDRTFRDKPFSTIGPIQMSVNGGEGQHQDRRGPVYDPEGGARGGGYRGDNKGNSQHFGPVYDSDYATARGKFTRTNDRATHHDHGGRVVAGGYLKSKDLCMVPQRLFIALQDDGWWVRSILPWVKRNGMPESISDRPANSLEQVALLTKSQRYWYDADAVRKVASPATNARVAQNVAKQAGSLRANGGAKTNGPMKAVVRKPGVGPKSAAEHTSIPKSSWHESTPAVLNDRNLRNTDLFFSSLRSTYGLISDADGTPLALDVPTQGTTEAHYATFPPTLIAPLILAGCPKGGVVLDPFAGIGTTGLVADGLGRNAVLIELNPKDVAIMQRRIGDMFREVAAE